MSASFISKASAGFMSEGEPRSERENYRGKASNSTIYPRDPDQGLKHDKTAIQVRLACPLSEKQWDRTVSDFSIALISEWR